MEVKHCLTAVFIARFFIHRFQVSEQNFFPVLIDSLYEKVNEICDRENIEENYFITEQYSLYYSAFSMIQSNQNINRE